MQQSKCLFAAKLVFFMFCLNIISGCASKYGTQTTEVVYFPGCYQPIASLRQSESNFRQTTATGSVIGALLGGLVGVMATGKVQGAAIGAATGAVAGGAAGYYQANQNQQREDNQLMSSYLSELNGDISNLNRVTASGRLAIQCYDKMFKETLRDYKSGRLTKSQLMARYQEIRSGSAEANEIMGTALGGAFEKEKEYQTVLHAEYNKANLPPPNTYYMSPTKDSNWQSNQNTQRYQSSNQHYMTPDSNSNWQQNEMAGSQRPQAVQPAQSSSRRPVQQSRPRQSAQTAPVELQKMSAKTQDYSNSLAEMENVRNELAEKQASWDRDLLALKG